MTCQRTQRVNIGSSSPTAKIALPAAVLLAVATVAFAQRIWVGGGGFSRVPPKWATTRDFDGSFLYCRGHYTSVRREGGGQGWSTDYPGADNNFSVRLAELTRVFIRLNDDRQPNTVVVRLADAFLFRCPILFMEDVGTIELSEAEVQNLRAYFQKGGFLWVDDYWGTRAWAHWVSQIERVLPSGEYPIFDLPLDHPLMHALYDVKRFLQVSSIQFWSMSGGNVSERGSDSQPVHYRGIQDAYGRLIVLMTHNTDVADTWEREGENPEYFDKFSPSGYAFGVNMVLYAMTH
ncbi:MAG: DUF4159 domain-containing protein [Acidimicrobiia bacterium]|nr:DUF4159 domain-containing protein [Acidimicrobiia bacterium]